MSPAVEVYETTSSEGVAGGVVSGEEEGAAEVGVEAEDDEHEITPSELSTGNRCYGENNNSMPPRTILFLPSLKVSLRQLQCFHKSQGVKTGK